MQIEVGIVGCGNSARNIHSPVLSKCPEKFKVVACCDIAEDRAEEIGKLYGAKPYTDLDCFLKHPGLRLVLVTTKPPSTHTEVGLKALAAGKDVLLEKPMCGSHKEGVSLIKAARKHKKVLTVYHNRRWDPEFLELRWAIQQGFFGDIRIFETIACGNLVGVAWLLDWGVHLIDQALIVGAGNPVEVTCAASFPNGKDNDSGPCGPWTAFIRFDNGRVSKATMMIADAGYPRFCVAGDKGGCAWPHGWGRIDMQGTTLATELPEIYTGNETGGEPSLPRRKVSIPFVPFYDNLYDVLNGKAELAVTPEEALRVIDVTMAAIESAQSGRSIKLSLA